VGHRITGDRQQGRSYGDGFDKVHVAVDDATRLAYVEVQTGDQKQTMIGFLSRAVAWFNAQGVECRRVMSNNCPAYVSKAFDKGLQHPGAAAHPHQALHPQNQREGRKVHPDPLLGIGLCHGLPELRGAEPLAAPLPVAL